MGKIGITSGGLETNSEEVKKLFLMTHPIGSLYFSLVETSPEILFGGKWTRITNAFIMCAGDQYPAGQSGGSATVNLRHTHTTGNHTLTVDEMPSHTHTNSAWYQAGFVGGGTGTSANITCGGGNFTIVYPNHTGGSQPHNHGNTSTSGSTAQSIIPPYVSYYCWRRQE